MRIRVDGSCRWVALAAALLLSLAACHHGGDAPAVPDRSREKIASEQSALSDPCASRLHDIGGAILMYYAINRRMPERLDELRPMADIDMDLKFTCPVSQQPYGYVPAGLTCPGRAKRIIAFDSAPSHDGKRWCLFMPEIKPGAAVSVEVLDLPEPIFNAYLATVPAP